MQSGLEWSESERRLGQVDTFEGAELDFDFLVVELVFSTVRKVEIAS